ncbi:lysis protein [Salmonella enterica]|uniref:lysis protein n=1 Tax=Salmonella enterica TaxID=28901 RepID=UPI0030AEDB79
MNRVATGVIVVLLIVAAVLAWTTDHYHGNAVKYKEQRDTATHKLALANATITDMMKRQRDVAALDARYTKELADANATIESLRADVSAGRKRLQVSATCAKSTTGTSGYRLRSGIDKITAQVNYLQEYIRAQCLK